MKEWRKHAREKGILGIFVGRKKDVLEIDCLAFAVDLAIFAKDAEDVIKLINFLNEVAEKKLGYRFPFRK